MTFIIKLMTSQTCLFTRDRNKIIYIKFFLQASFGFGVILPQTYKDMTLYSHMYQNMCCNLLQKNYSILEQPFYKGLNSRKIVSVSLCLVPF